MKWAQALDYICSYVCNKCTFLAGLYMCFASLKTAYCSVTRPKDATWEVNDYQVTWTSFLSRVYMLNSIFVCWTRGIGQKGIFSVYSATNDEILWLLD